MSEIVRWAWPFLIALLVWVLLASGRAVISGVVESEKEKKELQEELAHLRAKPQLHFQIQEAFIIPKDESALCFVRLRIHNNSNVPCKNIHEFIPSLKSMRNNTNDLVLSIYRATTWCITSGKHPTLNLDGVMTMTGNVNSTLNRLMTSEMILKA